MEDIGVYLIRNNKTNQIYVGSSRKSIKQRWKYQFRTIYPTFNRTRLKAKAILQEPYYGFIWSFECRQS